MSALTDNNHVLEEKRVLVTGGTGSLGKAVFRRFVTGELGTPEHLTVFLREGKRHEMRIDFAVYSSADSVVGHDGIRQILRKAVRLPDQS